MGSPITGPNTSAGGSVGAAAGTGGAGNNNGVANVAAAQAQMLQAMLQQNGFPFAFSQAHFGPPNYNGAAGHLGPPQVGPILFFSFI